METIKKDGDETMPEENTDTEAPEAPKKDVDKSSEEKPKTPTTLDKYQQENNRREELLKQETDLQERKEKLHAEQMLGGGSEAGQAPEKPKELTDEEYKDKILSGEKPE